MKKITLIIILSLFAYNLNSQCINGTENSIFISSNDGFTQTFSPNLETFEYNTVTGMIIGHNYQIKSIHGIDPEISDYITVTNTSNTVLYHGISPLVINNLQYSSIRIHVRTDAACNTDTYTHKVRLIDLTLTATTCQKPTVDPKTTLIYRSDTRMDIIWYAPEYSTPEGYEWIFVPQGGGTSFSGTTIAPNTSISTGDLLASDTNYDISIRSTCGVNGYSDYTTFSIKTNVNPPPVNDLCSGAITLIEQTSIANAGAAISTGGTLLGGAGTDVVAEVCNVKSGNAKDDVWYKFVAKTSNINITVEPNPSFDAVITLYSGNCNSLSYLACSDSNNNGNEEINYTGLTIGQTYYTRTYFFGGITPSTPIFNIKIWSSTPATDADNDGYVASVDCNDNDPNINPETVWYLDADGDNYAISTLTQCTSPGPGYTISVLPLTDCNDSDSNINPDTIWFLDADGDNYAVSTMTQCTSPGTGYAISVLPLTDCDDTDNSIHPGAIEIWYDGIDQNCDGQSDYDQDGDGYDSESFGGNDCDDTKVAVNPGVTEIEGNGLDDDCNPSTPDMPLGVEEFDLNNVRIVPNPFIEKITIYLSIEYRNDKFDTYIYDINGRAIFELSSIGNNGIISINNLDVLQQGLYFIKISRKADGKSIVRQLIKY